MHNVIFLLNLSPLNYNSIDYLKSWLDFLFPYNDDLLVTMKGISGNGCEGSANIPNIFLTQFPTIYHLMGIYCRSSSIFLFNPLLFR